MGHGGLCGHQRTVGVPVALGRLFIMRRERLHFRMVDE